MSAVAEPFQPSETMPLSQPATYAAATIQPVGGSLPSPVTDNSTSSSSVARAARRVGSLQLPPFITNPIELALGTIGKFAASLTSLVGFSGDIATRRARPWIEFADLSAFKPADNGFKGYIDRLKLNAPYFLFNYIISGMALSIISIITKPLAIVGVGLLIWIYFQFFGAETRDGDFVFFGLSLNTYEKIGAMVTLGLIVFWITAGGLQIFISILSASALIMLVHGSFRKPSHDMITPSV